MAKFGSIIATLENLSEEGQLGATEAAMNAAETATDVAEGNVEVIKDIAEIDSTDTAIEDAFEAETKIENLLEGAEDTMKEGGLSDKEARLIEVSHESIMKSLGLSHRANLSINPVASLEHFKGDGRGSATLVTIEKLSATAKDIGNKIIAALKAALNTVMSFLAALTRNRAVLEKHLLNLQKQVAAISTDEKKKDRISAGAAALSIDGSATVATAKKMLDGADKLITASANIADAIKREAGGGEARAAIKAAVNGLGPLTHNRTVSAKEEDGRVVVSIDSSTNTAETIEAPGKADMNALLTQALGVLRRLKEFDKTQTKLKDAVTAFTNLLKEGYDRVRSKVGSDKSKDDHSLLAAARANARQARGMMSKAGGSFPGAAFQAIKAVGDYVSGGIRNMGKGEAEKDSK